MEIFKFLIEFDLFAAERGIKPIAGYSCLPMVLIDKKNVTEKSPAKKVCEPDVKEPN